MMARAIVSRVLHEPTVRLKRVGETDAGWAHLQALRELFGIDPLTAAPGTEALPADRGEVRSLADHRRRQQRSG